jgi:hypothetical protein
MKKMEFVMPRKGTQHGDTVGRSVAAAVSAPYYQHLD